MINSQMSWIVTRTAGEALTKNRMVDFETKHTADIPAVGVALESASSGELVPVQVGGICIVEAGDAVTAGNLLKADSSGRAVPLTLSTAETDVPKLCGVALTGASAAGTLIEVKLAF